MTKTTLEPDKPTLQIMFYGLLCRKPTDDQPVPWLPPIDQGFVWLRAVVKDYNVTLIAPRFNEIAVVDKVIVWMTKNGWNPEWGNIGFTNELVRGLLLTRGNECVTAPLPSKSDLNWSFEDMVTIATVLP